MKVNIHLYKWWYQGTVSSVFLFVVFLFTWHIPAHAKPLSEEQAKSALIYNLLKNTHWPNEKQLQFIKLGFYGPNSALMAKLSSIADKLKVRGLPVQVQKLTHLSQVSDVQALVVSPHTFNLDVIWKEIGQQAVLLITEKAKVRNSVMINIVYPDQNRLGFEVNRSNILNSGLVLSRDILLYGGSDIEVAALYQEMETALINIKAEVHMQKLRLKEKLNELKLQEQKIQQQKQHMNTIQLEVQRKSKQLKGKEQALEEVRKNLQNSQLALEHSRNQIAQKTQAVDKLSASIRRNNKILVAQQEAIKTYKEESDKHRQLIVEQEETIASQRNIILYALFLLLLAMLLIIIRQAKMLRHERALLKAKEELARAQAESIAAYEASLRTKNNFLAAINHELRTPMHGILGALQVADESSHESLLDTLTLVDACAEDMMRLIEDMITYTEVQSGPLILQPEAVVTRQLFQPLVDYYQRACERKGLNFIFEYDQTVPEYLILDSHYLLIALEKLLENAVKFTLQGWVKLSLYFTEGELLLSIADSGIGMDKQQQEQMQEAFNQRDGGMQRRFGGLGIGLSIAYKIIENMQGSLELESAPEQGCRWQSSCPVGVSREPKTIPIQDAEKTGQIYEPVLVVEDNQVNQMIMKKMLSSLGYSCELAEHGEQALEIIKQKPISLVLMDLQMPGMDGFECAANIRNLSSEAASTPILALSANLNNEQKQRCQAVGMDNYLSKPLNMVTLQTVLAAYIRKPEKLLRL